MSAGVEVEIRKEGKRRHKGARYVFEMDLPDADGAVPYRIYGNDVLLMTGRRADTLANVKAYLQRVMKRLQKAGAYSEFKINPGKRADA